MCCEAQGVILISGSIKHVPGCQLAIVTCKSDLPLRNLRFIWRDVNGVEEVAPITYHKLSFNTFIRLLHILNENTKKMRLFLQRSKNCRNDFLRKSNENNNRI